MWTSFLLTVGMVWECCDQPASPSPCDSNPAMAKGTNTPKHDRRCHHHCEEQLGLAHTEYDYILALGGKPWAKIFADAFGVPWMSLQNWINGIESKRDSAAQHQKILPEEETVMVQYLIETVKWGFPDTPQHAVRHANQILTKDVQCTIWNWVQGSWGVMRKLVALCRIRFHTHVGDWSTACVKTGVLQAGISHGLDCALCIRHQISGLRRYHGVLQ